MDLVQTSMDPPPLPPKSMDHYSDFFRIFIP